jgi:hypothetical protein
MELVRVLVFILGGVLVVSAILSAIRTFVLPRSYRDSISRFTFLNIRRVFNIFVRKAFDYSQRDRIMAYYGPLGLLILQLVWLFLVQIGYMFMFWALGFDDWLKAYTVSGSCLLTLGFASVNDFPETVLGFSEATIGLILVALLIAYLPTLYTSFSNREKAVARLEVRAGSPPSATEMLLRYNRIRGLDQLAEIWTEWENWFIELGESHTTFGALAFFRSSQSKHSWVTAAGAVLDAAALIMSVVDVPRDARSALCLRAGFLNLRRIADFYRLPYNPDPQPTDPISISRSEFNDACLHLAEGGVPLKEDLDQGWHDFAGWRVNYDQVLLGLAGITMAPEAPWSSDRSLRIPLGGVRQKR